MAWLSSKGNRRILSNDMAMKFYAGIDGGGTRTRAFVLDASGAHGGWSEAGLSNPNHATSEELRANITSALRAACQTAGAKLTDCVSVFLGIAGITTEKGRARFQELAAKCQLAHAQIGVDHDIRTALAGGLGGQPGIALIVGTGSSCYGRTADQRTWQTGGWEATISDEGSGYFLGLQAMALAARIADGRTPESPLRTRVFQWLGIEHIAQILPRLHEQGLSRTEIAAFAPELIQLARQGDVAALEILDRGAFLLAELVATNHRMLPTGPWPDVVITGGLGLAKTLYREKIQAAILAQLPTARIHEPLLAPAIGAVLLAMEQVGHKPTPDFITHLKRFVLPESGAGILPAEGEAGILPARPLLNSSPI